MNLGGRLRQLLTILLVAAACVFLYHTAATNWRDLGRFQWQVDGWILALSVVAHVAVLAWGVLIWSWVLRYFPVPRPRYAALLRIWAFSNATRYVPGAIWQFFAAAHLSRGAGLPAVVALTSMVVHVAFSLLAACTVAVATLPLSILGWESAAARYLPLAVMAASTVLVHPAVINGSLRLLGRMTRHETLSWHGRWRSGITLLLLSNLSWLLYGVAYFLFVAALAPAPWTSLPRLAGINALSFAAGYVAVLAPGGLGVRESAMALMLSAVLPAGVAAIIAIAARLWSVIAEVLLALLGMIWTAAEHPPAGK